MAGSDPDAVTAPKEHGGPHHAHHAHRARPLHANAHHHGGAFHHHIAAANPVAAAPAIAPPVQEALHAAMAKEGVPSTWEAGLQFIMGHESSGHVGITNTHDSARGLFQLTRANYHLNPNGAQSFGNATEEAQGGIRYISGRYQTADNAMQFWRRHGWY